MKKRTLRETGLYLPLLLCALAVAIPSESRGTDRADDAGGIAEHMAKASINVVITVSDMEKAKVFYGGVMGLEPMSPIRFGEGSNPVFFAEPTTMERFRVGTHEVKLITSSKPLPKQPGGVAAGIGFRMIAFPIDDIEALLNRVKAHGLAAPEVHAMEGTPYRFGMLRDPDDNEVEFYTYEGGTPENGMKGLQIALTVSDVEESRRFYGEVLGLEALPAVPMPGRPEVTVNLFRMGDTIVKFWSFGPDLPTYSGRHLAAYGFRYLQYQVKNIDAVHEFVKARGGTIDLPPTSMQSMPVKLMFVADPDGVINEFFGMGR